jgi:hypothetical protein
LRIAKAIGHWALGIGDWASDLRFWVLDISDSLFTNA